MEEVNVVVIIFSAHPVRFSLRCLMSVNHETSAFLSVFAKIKKFLMKNSFETRNKILILLWYFKFLIHGSCDKLLFLPNKFGQYFDTCHLLKQRICKVVKLDPLPFVRTSVRLWFFAKLFLQNETPCLLILSSFSHILLLIFMFAVNLVDVN